MGQMLGGTTCSKPTDSPCIQERACPFKIQRCSETDRAFGGTVSLPALKKTTSGRPIQARFLFSTMTRFWLEWGSSSDLNKAWNSGDNSFK